MSGGKLYARNRRHLAATTERVEEKATRPDEKSELYGSTFQNYLPAAQDNPLLRGIDRFEYANKSAVVQRR
jgi:hypothetical protein